MVAMDPEHFFPSNRHEQYHEHHDHYEYSIPITPSQPQSPQPRRLLTSTATPIHHGETLPLMHNAFRNYGLLITLDDDQLCLQFCPDHSLGQVHPNAYAPTEISHIQKLGGGGSGVAVFEGQHPVLGDVVMKHGSDKDLVELFALSTVADELKTRGHGDKDNQAAARHIQQRIPEFKFIYISPHHLGENRKALWRRLRDLDRGSSGSFLLPVDEMTELSSNSEEESDSHSKTTKMTSSERSRVSFLDEETMLEEDDYEDGTSAAEANFQLLKKVSSLQSVVSKDKPNPELFPPGVEITKSGTVSGHRDIAILVAPRGTTDQCFVKLKADTLRIVLPAGKFDQEEPSQSNNSGHTGRIRIHGDGYTVLKAITDDLITLMKSNRWKFTFGQKRIGSANPKTGNEWLYEARLCGSVLNNLVTQKIKLVWDLVRLTADNEQDPKVLEQIREEVQQMKECKHLEAEDLSDLVDNYVGNAIKKNFRSETGRIPVLLLLGTRFREYSEYWTQSFLHIGGGNKRHNRQQSPFAQSSGANMILTTEEKVPAHYLGCITNPGALVGDFFQKAPMVPTVLENMGSGYWQCLLSKAVELPDQNCHSSMYWKRLWTSGLADAGLHNLFVTEDRLWLFDLGEPTLTSVPGFLTKFLFSFFHTLGMQERNDGADNGGMWIRRFELNHRTKKLNLTTETNRLLAKGYKAFQLSLDRIVKEVFNGDDTVRWLLLQYVTLQLISDASFCLQKWTVKGGGRARDMNHQEGLEKWLWRALWDIFVACDINSPASLKRFKATTPEPHMSDAQRVFQERHVALIQGLAFENVTIGGGDGFKGFHPFVNASG
ncbi:expressed unknown protein [Seminavis robusta]|uniref:Uncharacterized protein n=1 Tax=Seminavis robusta TaxID=568900 RepID=A0A9N8DYX0_9STRA|nr:expressed unknown protein [Seminavis robusta]|eukprot:Sro400_g134990.1 n/a (829) ;mRNA; r:5874-8549